MFTVLGTLICSRCMSVRTINEYLKPYQTIPSLIGKHKLKSIWIKSGVSEFCNLITLKNFMTRLYGISPNCWFAANSDVNNEQVGVNNDSYLEERDRCITPWGDTDVMILSLACGCQENFFCKVTERNVLGLDTATEINAVTVWLLFDSVSMQRGFLLSNAMYRILDNG